MMEFYRSLTSIQGYVGWGDLTITTQAGTTMSATSLVPKRYSGMQRDIVNLYRGLLREGDLHIMFHAIVDNPDTKEAKTGHQVYLSFFFLLCVEFVTL